MNSACFSCDGSTIVSISLDNSIKLFHSNQLFGTSHQTNKRARMETDDSACDSINHNNYTGRWLTKLKICSSPLRSEYFAVGCMNQPRCIELYRTRTGGKVKLSKVMELRNDDWLQSVQSVIEFHPSRNVLVGGNSSGRVHVFEPDIE